MTSAPPTGRSLKSRFPGVVAKLKGPYAKAHEVVGHYALSKDPAGHRASKVSGEHMVGYYDRSPWNADDSRFVLMRIPFSDRHPTIRNEAVIESIDTGTGESRDIATTRTWSTQQGCRLQWLGPSFLSKIIFNDHRDGNHVSVIRDVRTDDERVIERPIYDVAPNGRVGLSLDFDRLDTFRKGYGYDRGGARGTPQNNIHDPNQIPTKWDSISDDDGIAFVDLEKNDPYSVVSLKTIAKESHGLDVSTWGNRFNHIMIGPDGARFMFLYRWRVGPNEYSRLYTANLDGSDRFCVAKDEMVSHTAWGKDGTILGWARQFGTGDAYYLFNDGLEEVEKLGMPELNEDGHPSFSPVDHDLVLTDTYPGKFRIANVLLANRGTGNVSVVGKYFHSLRFSGSLRCDLHPRWNYSGTKISFDSVHEGERQTYIIDDIDSFT